MLKHASILLVLLSVNLRADDVTFSTEPAKKAVARFYTSLFSQHWADAAKVMHPDALKQVHDLYVHIGQTPKDERDGQEFLKMFGVSSVAELQAMTPEAFFSKLFSVLFPLFSKDTQRLWTTSRAQIIGCVTERPDLVHVVVRTTAEADSTPVSAVSVASVQRVDSEWKLLTTVELQRMLSKLKQ